MIGKKVIINEIKKYIANKYFLTVSVVTTASGSGSKTPGTIKVKNFKLFTIVFIINTVGCQMADF